MNQIDSFSGTHGFLSNFWPAIVYFNGIRFVTVEHAYQAAKSDDINIQRQFALLKKPGHAKQKGKRIKVRENWYVIKNAVMEDLVRQKFTMEPNLKHLLLSTGRAELIEGNTWGGYLLGCMQGNRGKQPRKNFNES